MSISLLDVQQEWKEMRRRTCASCQKKQLSSSSKRKKCARNAQIYFYLLSFSLFYLFLEWHTPFEEKKNLHALPVNDHFMTTTTHLICEASDHGRVLGPVAASEAAANVVGKRDRHGFVHTFANAPSQRSETH